MCYPLKILPNNYFLKMSEITKSFKFKELSMGMSSDYIKQLIMVQHSLELGLKFLVKDLKIYQF